MENIINWQNNDYGVTEPIKVTLDGDGDTSVGFEQAFGDYSEARGRRRERRRARRQERKMKRIARRMERKKARVQARIERKQMRADARAMRKGGGDEEGSDDTSADAPTDTTGVATEQEPTSAPTPVAQQDEPSYGGTTEPVGDSEPLVDDNGVSDTAEEEQAVDNETGESDEESGFTGDYGFDGQRQPSEIDVYWDNFYSSAEGEQKIHPRVTDLSRRIERHKELAKRIEARILKINTRIETGKSFRNDANLVSMLTERLAKVKSRLAELESKLAGYTKFVGEWSDASGEQWKENARRRAEVRKAKRLARKERHQFIRSSRKARIQELMAQMVAKGVPRKEARMRAREQAKAEFPFKTPVDSSLNPQIGDNKIEVPASDVSSSFSGTGLIGLDNYNDIDAPPVRNFELDFSNASGSMKGNWKWIAIGVVVAVGGIFAYNKWIRKR